MKLHCTELISKSPECVFPWMADPKMAVQWQTNVKGGEIIKAVPEMVGTTFRETVTEGGNDLEMEGVITDFVRNRLIGFHLSSKIHEFDVRYFLSGVGTGSEITVQADIHWKFPMNIVSIFIGNRMQQTLNGQIRKELQELKRICESG